MDHSGFARIPLQACVEELRRRCQAACRLQGGHTHFLEELRIFREYAAEQGWAHLPPPPELTLTPSDQGNEHQVWFRESSRTFLKATWPGFFGLKVVHRPDEDPCASPIDYLERWHWHNLLFADQLSFLGVHETPAGLRLLVEQPAVAGTPATHDHQIRDFFVGNGWQPFHADGELAYLDSVNDLAISDAHRGNLILMPDGLLAPIDLRVQRLTGSLLETVKSLAESPRRREARRP